MFVALVFKESLEELSCCRRRELRLTMHPTSALLVSLLLASTTLQSAFAMKCRSDEDSSEEDSSFQDILQTCRNEERNNQQEQFGSRNNQEQFGGRNNQDQSEDSGQDTFRGQRRSESEHRNSRTRYEVGQQESGNRGGSRYEVNQQNNGNQDSGRNSQNDRRNLNDRFNFNQNSNDQRRERSDNRSSQNSENRFSVQNRMGSGQDDSWQSQDQDRDSSSNGDGDSDDLEQLDPCTVHCIFRHMQMLDRRGLPDKAAAITAMTRGVRERHVRRFVADAVDECHDLARADAGHDRCRFAKNLALCFQERGRRTCDDWDEPSPSATSSKYPYYKQY